MNGRILIAEDDRVLAEIVRFNLAQAGFDVVIAVDGQEATDFARSSEFDLIISDYQMPRMTGEEFCHEVRRESLNRSTPIFFCSAKGYEFNAERLREELDVSAVFLKPFSPRELVESVCETLHGATSGT